MPQRPEPDGPQATAEGAGTPVPKRADVLADLRKAAKAPVRETDPQPEG